MEEYLLAKTEEEIVEFPSDDDTSEEEENANENDDEGEDENIDFVMGNLGSSDDSE